MGVELGMEGEKHRVSRENKEDGDQIASSNEWKVSNGEKRNTEASKEQ
jgi:hypothetical protein